MFDLRFASQAGWILQGFAFATRAEAQAKVDALAVSHPANHYEVVESAAKASVYEIVDRHTGLVVATAKTRAGARRAADRRDNAYGAYRYYVRAKSTGAVCF